jgi:ubiquinone/menaquinone biosynthesis C-methylase UbiE
MQRKKMTTYYQEIAPDYARHRHVHPEVLRDLIRNGPIHGDSCVLEIGCGTGNYICALRESVGCHCWGIDPSDQMLQQAAGRSPSVQITCGRAENIAFPEESFDLMFSVDVIHHITDRKKAFSEAMRVLRPKGRLCIVTDSEEILRNRQPQSIYFPETVDVELSRYPAIDLLRTELIGSGFAELAETVVEFSSVLPDIEPYRSKVFSSLRLISDEAFASGMARLERDFQQGPIPWVSRYVMLWGTKLAELGPSQVQCQAASYFRGGPQSCAVP